MAHPTVAAVALGSNVGDRPAHLAFARLELAKVLSGITASSEFDTEPVGVPPQARFLNAVVIGTTTLEPRALLSWLLAVEQARGRERPAHGAPRTLDLDLILYGDRRIDEPGLVVPHPRFRERLFVLEPLAQIAASLRDPVTGLTIDQLLEQCRQSQRA